MLLSQQSIANTEYQRNKSPTAQLLEDLTCRVVQHVAAHDFAHPDFDESMSDDYTAYLEYQETPLARGRQAYLDNYRAFTAANPYYTIQPISVVADVHENNCTASVWMLLKVEGHPRDVQRESVTIVYWRRRAGQWQAYKQTGMRGVGMFMMEPDRVEARDRA
jgi:hypothetical protein